MIKYLLPFLLAATAQAEIKDGWDFSLPSHVTPSPNAWVKPFNMDDVDINWINVERKKGQYDWSEAKASIDRVAKKGKGIELHIKGATWTVEKWKNGKSEVQEGRAPRWLKDVPKIKEKKVSNANKPFQITNLDISHKDYHDAYVGMLKSLKKSGIPDNPALAVVYIHNASKSKGEEGHLKKYQRENFIKRLHVWADVFGKNVGKLVYVGQHGPVLDAAVALGMGQRSGYVEDYLASVDNSDLCQQLDKDGYLTFVEKDCPFLDGRAFGDENEEYEGHWQKRFGPKKYFPHRYRESMLRMLQMRRNFLWTYKGSLEPPLLDYVKLSLGKTVKDTPDAWTYLRESYVEKGPVKNFERWIYQRDAKGAETTPTLKVDIPVRKGDRDKKKDYDYVGREATEAINFAVDDRFLSGKQNVEVKITYWDEPAAEWYVDIPGCKSEVVKNELKKDFRTLTYKCSGVFSAVGMATDFRIVVLKGKPVFSFVRLIKGDEVKLPPVEVPPVEVPPVEVPPVEVPPVEVPPVEEPCTCPCL